MGILRKTKQSKQKNQLHYAGYPKTLESARLEPFTGIGVSTYNRELKDREEKPFGRIFLI